MFYARLQRIIVYNGIFKYLYKNIFSLKNTKFYKSDDKHT